MACCCCDRRSGPQRLMRSFLEHRSSRTFSMRYGIAGRTGCSSGCCCCFLGTVACCYCTRFGVASGAFLSRLCWCRWYSCCSSCHARSIAVSPAKHPIITYLSLESSILFDRNTVLDSRSRSRQALLLRVNNCLARSRNVRSLPVFNLQNTSLT